MPISLTGIPSSDAIASAIPPLAVPSSLVKTIPETSIASELGIPVKLIGVGEQLEDLRPFDAGEFARALVS